MNTPFCCGFEAKWVENIAGKGYFYCGECKKEVLCPVGDLEEAPAVAPFYESWFTLNGTIKKRPGIRLTQDAVDDDADGDPTVPILYDPSLLPQD